MIGPDGSFRTQIELTLPNGAAIDVETSATAPATRAVQDEKNVTDLWVLQFDVSSAAGALVRAEYLTKVDISGGKLRAETILIVGDKMQLVLVANTHDPNLYAAPGLPIGATLAQFDAIGIAVTALKGTSLPSDASTGLPMIGRTAEAGIKLPVANNTVTLTMQYAVAKMTFSLDLSQLPPERRSPPGAWLCYGYPKRSAWQSRKPMQ